MSSSQVAEAYEIGQVNADSEQYLTFLLADEEYGIDILRVQEIRGWSQVTSIPNTPDYIKGVVNLRGAIVPIIDLRERFHLADIDYGLTTVVIILKVEREGGERIVGIVVDAVSDVYSLPAGELSPAPDFGGVINADFLRGLATVGEKMIILLDIDGLINSEILASVDEVSQ